MAATSEIWLIDDDYITNFINQQLLMAYNVTDRIEVFFEAQQAINVLESNQEINNPNLIFVDLNMPEMDGFEFLEAFNKLPQQISSGVKVIVLSSSTNRKDLLRVYNLGFYQYLVKPLNVKKLNKVLNILAV